MEARQEENPTSLDMKPDVAKDGEVSVEDAEVMPVGEPKKKRRKDRKLAAESSRQMNEWTQDGYWKGLTVARRGTSHRVKVAWQTKETSRKMSGSPRVTWRKRSVSRRNHTRAMIERATQRVGPLKKKLRKHHKGTKDQRGKLPLHGRKKRITTDGNRKWRPGERAFLGSKRALKKILYEKYGPKNTKRMPKASSRTRRITDWTLWKGRHLRNGKSTVSRPGNGNVEILTSSW
jgi:hypothetical protein